MFMEGTQFREVACIMQENVYFQTLIPSSFDLAQKHEAKHPGHAPRRLCVPLLL